ncbi:MAG: Na+/H+ antiporter subunit E [Gammaproteobacteria bacterium]|nr:Na+/H+ antiporter subunit E [Gammaproteobacteria bacterium]
MKISHIISLGLTLSILWLLLSGHYTALLLSLGLASVLLVVFIAHRMDVADQEGHPVDLRIIRLLAYWGWLLKQIVLSNIDVCRRILHPRLPISPTIVRLPCSQPDDLGRVIYANSITLTPGTVTLSVDREAVEVHALSQEAAEELAKGEMDRRVTRIMNV